jgi:hypothetical protein
MKTKDKYKKSEGRRVPDRTPNVSGCRPEGGARLLAVSTAKSREQSENVYENKGQVQKVAES